MTRRSVLSGLGKASRRQSGAWERLEQKGGSDGSDCPGDGGEGVLWGGRTEGPSLSYPWRRRWVRRGKGEYGEIGEDMWG
jgi:hypothetical protein